MAIGEDMVRLQVIVDRETAARIQECADAMGASVSRMSARLLVAAVDDNEWMIKNVFGPANRLQKRLRKLKPSGEKPEKG